MDSSSTYSDQLRLYLKGVLRRTALLHLASGLISFCAAAAWVLVGLIIWTASNGEPTLGATTAVSRTVGVVVALLFGYFVVWPLVRMPRINDLANEVEKRQDLRELVRAGFEFSNDDTASQRYSPELVKEVIRQAIEKVDGLEVRFLFLSKQDMALMPVAYGGLFVLLILSLFNPTVMMNASHRVVKPVEAAAEASRANIQVWPGNTTVLAGSDVVVTGLDFGDTEEGVTVSFNLADDFWKTESTKRVDGDAHAQTTESFDRYEYELSDLRHTVSYYFQSGDYKSDVYTITVVNEPMLTDMTLKLTPPSYTGEDVVVLKDSGGNVQALEGTKVEVAGTSNNELASAKLSFGDGKVSDIETNVRDIAFDFTALKDGHYSVLLEDVLGYKTKDPLVYSVEVFQDHAPALDVLEPGGDTTLPRNSQLDVGFIASDDYGVRSAAIYHRKNGETEFNRVPIALEGQRNARDVAMAYRWNLKGQSLFPGNYIEYFVQVADNNTVTGPGVTRSRIFQITVPTMAELYDRAREQDAERSNMLDQAIEDSEEFRERLEKIKREFIKTEKMEWAQKKDVDKALEQQKAVEESIDQIKKSLDETLQELAENEMTSQEIGEKMEEIRNLLEEIDSEELREHMKDLREAVEKLDPDDIREALDNLDMDTEKMMEKLERTAQLLKQIQKEQQMEQMVRESKALMDAQKDLNEQTSETSENDSQKMNELSEQQDKLKEKADELQKSAEDIAKQNADDKQMSEAMQEMSESMKKDNEGPQENMEQASQELKQQNKQSAMQQQQEAMDKMISLFQKASKAQQQMQQQQGQQMAANFQKFAKQTLDLSFKQEQLSQSLQEQRRGEESRDMKSLAQEQMSYLKATEKVADGIMQMAGLTLTVSPELMDALGEAISRMQNSMLFLEQNKPFMSTAHAHNAIESLNKATIEMLSSAQQCSQGSPSSSGESMAQQLMQQLIPQQQDVLSQTREMMQMQMVEEALRQQQQAELDRLAGQQRSLQDIARQIQEEMKKERTGLGRLDKTIEEMERVAEAIRRGEINDDLVNREQRILSRLLDAERSIHTRDYDKTRESVTAEDVFSKSLGVRGKDALSESLREEIRRAMQLKAPGEFEDLIKLYFRALAEEQSAGTSAN